MSVDGGKVRLRGVLGEGTKRARLALRYEYIGIYYNALFQDNQSLIDFVNAQPLTNTLVCLGDGHDGIWNLVRELATPETRWEILDWDHLRENLLHCWRVEAAIKTS